MQVDASRVSITPDPISQAVNRLAASYDLSAASYEANFKALQFPKYRALLRAPDVRPLLSRRVLDLGCGTGLLREFCERELSLSSSELRRWVGLDISLGMLARAQMKGLNCICGSARSLPFQNGSFDLVCAFTSLGLTGAINEELAEAFRVLSPGGTLIASVLSTEAEALQSISWANFAGQLIPCGQDTGFILTKGIPVSAPADGAAVRGRSPQPSQLRQAE